LQEITGLKGLHVEPVNVITFLEKTREQSYPPIGQRTQRLSHFFLNLRHVSGAGQ
jgi:hypothetical protein